VIPGEELLPGRVLGLLLTPTRTDSEIVQFPPAIISHQWAWSNYYEAVTFIPYLLYTYNTTNTTVIAGLNVVGILFSCSLAAYAFSRVQWHGRSAVFLMVLSTMLLPYSVTLIPLYIIFKTLGMVGTFAPLDRAGLLWQRLLYFPVTAVLHDDPARDG
jgi:multiple sugar transport system permease protein